MMREGGGEEEGAAEKGLVTSRSRVGAELSSCFTELITMLASLRCSSLPATQVLRQHARKFCVEPRSFEPHVPPGLPADFTSLELLDSWSVSVDSKIIRLQLPEGVADLSALGAPSGVKVQIPVPC